MAKRKKAATAAKAEEAVAIIECPPELSAAARTEWDRIAPALVAAGRLTALDRGSLAILCTSYAEWVAANEALQSFGSVLKSPSGYPVQSPYVSIAAKHADTFSRLAAEFGLTPASRRRIPNPSSRSSWMDDIPALEDLDLKPLEIEPPDKR
jgi:P27 family predicted phage terminase small subunit